MNEYSEPRGMPYSGGNRYSGSNTANRSAAASEASAYNTNMRHPAVPPRPSQEHYAGQPRGRYSTIPPPPVHDRAQSAVSPPPAPVQTRNPAPSDLSALLGGLNLDEEKIIIIFLIVILARSGADLPLLAALGYLLM